MGILSIDFFVFGCNKDIKIAISLPLMLHHFYFEYFFLEDAITDNIPQQSITNILIFFMFVHEISEEDGEMNNI
jgi:hypothetical protein